MSLERAIVQVLLGAPEAAVQLLKQSPSGRHVPKLQLELQCVLVLM